MTGKKIMFTIALAAGSIVTSFGQGQEIVFSLVNTDKEFTLSLQEDGIRKAYLKYLDRESLVFTPTAAEGPDYYRDYEADSAGLVRFPGWAEVSDDGLLGYTTGPFEFRDFIYDEIPAATGHYLTIWRRKSAPNKSIQSNSSRERVCRSVYLWC